MNHIRHTVAMRQHGDDLCPLGPPDRRRLATRAPPGWKDLAVTLTLFGLSLPLFAVGWFGVQLSMSAFDAYGDAGCVDTVGLIASIGFPTAAVVNIVLWASVAERRRRARRRAWITGVAAILTIVVLFVLAAVVVPMAAQPN